MTSTNKYALGYDRDTYFESSNKRITMDFLLPYWNTWYSAILTVFTGILLVSLLLTKKGGIKHVSLWASAFFISIFVVRMNILKALASPPAHLPTNEIRNLLFNVHQEIGGLYFIMMAVMLIAGSLTLFKRSLKHWHGLLGYATLGLWIISNIASEIARHLPLN